jgi:tetratricopeptide (TPR) repeat protein
VQKIEPHAFVDKVQPALKAQDWDRFAATLRKNWSTSEILSLLDCDHCDARKIAALAIGLVGETSCLDELAAKLHDKDRMVVEMAEHAMWQIWFRGGSDVANKHLARGAEALNGHNIDKAMTHFNAALELSPDFPEAYNQRAIAHYMAEHYEESIADCRKAIKLMPLHFGAWSGMGHCHLAIGNLADALDAYERALSVNPHLDCVRELVQELREQMGDSK